MGILAIRAVARVTAVVFASTFSPLYEMKLGSSGGCFLIDRKLLRLQALGELTNQKPFMLSVSKIDSINISLYTSSCPRAVWLDWICKHRTPLALCASCPHPLCQLFLPPRPFSCCLCSGTREQPYLSRCPLGFVCHPQLLWQVISWTGSLSAELGKHRTKSGKASPFLKPASRAFGLEGTLTVSLMDSVFVGSLRFCVAEGN